MRILLPPLLLLLACSAPPRQYAQGVPVAPRPPAFDPVTDSPVTIGQPGYVGPVENLPRSPYGRVLPETPETRRGPGLWAVKGEGDIDWVHLRIVDVGFAMPVVEPGDPSERIARMCEAGLGKTAPQDARLAGAIKMLTPEDRRCLVMMVYRACIEVVRERFEETAAPSPTAKERYALRVAVGAARSAAEFECKPSVATAALDDLMTRWLSIPIPPPGALH